MMDTKLKLYLKDFLINDNKLDEDSLIEFILNIKFELPKDYLDFMIQYNGGEGEIGENGWLCLFPLQDLISTNEDLKFIMNQIPEFFVIGKDAADTLYIIHKKYKSYHSFGLMSNFNTDQIFDCGNSFNEFIESIYFGN